MKNYLERLGEFTGTIGSYPFCMDLVNILSQKEFIDFYKAMNLVSLKSWIDYTNGNRSNDSKLNYNEIYKEIGKNVYT